MTRRSLLLALCTPLLAASGVFAQDTAPATKRSSEFEHLFPAPTGNNACEDFLRAGERLQDSKIDVATANVGTLTEKRACLADPACQEALTILRQGLSKPFQFPKLNPLSAPFPYALLRRLGDILNMQIAVHFADGKNDAAIRTISDTLAFTAPFKGVSLITLLVGNAIDVNVLTRAARLKEVWIPRDCQHVIAVATQHLAALSPISDAINGEREVSLLLLAKWRSDPNTFRQTAIEIYGEEDEEKETPEQRQARQYSQMLQTDNGVRERVLSELSGAIQEYYDRTFALAKDPTRRMEITPSATADANRHPITVFLRDSYLPQAQALVQRGVENRLTMQLLAVHAAIRSYRWEYDKLPGSLNDIAIDKTFLRDPYSNQSLLYTANADTGSYRLASVGALLVDENGKEVHRGFTLPREPIKVS